MQYATVGIGPRAQVGRRKAGGGSRSSAPDFRRPPSALSLGRHPLEQRVSAGPAADFGHVDPGAVEAHAHDIGCEVVAGALRVAVVEQPANQSAMRLTTSTPLRAR